MGLRDASASKNYKCSISIFAIDLTTLWCGWSLLVCPLDMPREPIIPTIVKNYNTLSYMFVNDRMMVPYLFSPLNICQEGLFE